MRFLPVIRYPAARCQTVQPAVSGGVKIREALFGYVAAYFPTHRMGENKTLAALWRLPFYLLAPREPFVLRTRDYRLHAYPRKGTLTRALVRRGGWEPVQTNVFRDLLQPGDLAIDAGANFGHYALTAAKRVGPTGQVIAFEPHPETFAMLEANCQLLEVDNVDAVQAGLGSEDGTLRFYTDSENPGGHSYFDWNLRSEAARSETARVYALDSYLSRRNNGQRVSVIKIDVQGFEANVLNGAVGVIERDRPAVFCEVTPGALEKAGSSVNEVLDFFRERDYSMKILIDGSGGPRPIGREALLALLAETGAEYYDILFEAAP